MYKSAQEALMLAYRVSSKPIINTSNLLSGMRGSESLTAHDRHAQAAIVIAVVERSIDVVGQAYVLAHYNRELRGGEMARVVADTLVRSVMLSLPTGMTGRRGIEKLVKVYFGEKIGLSAIRKDLQCNNHKYYECKAVVWDALDRIGHRADDAAHRALDAAGLIINESSASPVDVTAFINNLLAKRERIIKSGMQ